MTQKFIIKEGKESMYYLSLLCLCLALMWASRTGGGLGGLFPLVFLLSAAALLGMIMLFRWKILYAVFLDINKQEIILNHTFFFRKKRISLNGIKEIDTLNGNIILFASTPLSKFQKMVSKTKNSDDYTVRFEIIESSERRELMSLLSKWKHESEERNFIEQQS